jgi:uncharacterized RDD family membrane protein YckC
MIEPKYSTFWPRFCAGFVDGLIFWPVGWLCSLAYAHSGSAFLQVSVYIVNSSAFLMYSIWMHGRFGQTLGKMACKVIVLDVSERRLSMKQAVLRDILGVVLLPVGLAIDIPRIVHGVNVYAPSSLTTMDWILTYSALCWFMIEVVTMLTNNKRRALHDFIAGSVVIRRPNQALEATADAPVS